MRILGYSERGIVNSLFYEIKYSSTPEELLEGLLSRARFPFVDEVVSHVSDAEILIEQSFSDFGDADTLLLIDTGMERVSVFVEAKVQQSQRKPWTIEEEFSEFLQGTQSTVSSSNLFTQLYHKTRLVSGLQKGGIEGLQEGISFPESSSKQLRRIGSNPVVIEAAKRLRDYMDRCYYLALVPDTSGRMAAFFDRQLRSVTPEGYVEWDVTNYGYLCWEEIEAFCVESGLKNTLQVFAFNGRQIYGQ